MDFIPNSPPPNKSAAEGIAEQMIANANADLARRVQNHREQYLAFWESEATPDAILAAMGNKAGILLAAASENVEHIARLAAVRGLTVDDFISPEFYQPRRCFMPSTDGNVTLSPPAGGLDAWGKTIAAEAAPTLDPEITP